MASAQSLPFLLIVAECTHVRNTLCSIVDIISDKAWFTNLAAVKIAYCLDKDRPSMVRASKAYAKSHSARLQQKLEILD